MQVTLCIFPLIMPGIKSKKDKNEHAEVIDSEFVERTTKRKKIEKPINDSLELANRLYEHLYINNSTLPFTVHKKKFEEAESAFESAIFSSASTFCIVLKGPTGCGKGYLASKLIEKYSSHVRECEIDSLPSISSFEQQQQHHNEFKCGNTIFPSLSFSTGSSIDSSQVDRRKVVSRFTDAHFFHSQKEYAQVRRSVEMLKTNSGIVLIEMTDFEFEGSMHNYILKILKEMFPNSYHCISLNPCAPTVLKKMLDPLEHLIEIKLGDFMEQFNGDPRALLHDLYAISLKPRQIQLGSLRDYRTDLFHYVGKMLYPSKTGLKVFDDVSFWDLDFDLYTVFLQYYFPKFCPDLEAISKMNDYFCTFDNVPWKVLKHVSVESHQNACKYTPLLACFAFINEPSRQKSLFKFFSFTRPPLVNENALKKKCRKLGLSPEEFYLKNIG